MVLGSCPKYFLHHHTLGNADKKQEAASFSLECVICPMDFTRFSFRHLTCMLKKYMLFSSVNGFNFLTLGGFQSENPEVQYVA